MKIKNFFNSLILFSSISGSGQQIQQYENIISNYYQQGYRYAMIPWVKEYWFLNSGSSRQIEPILNDLVLELGSNHFTNLNEKILNKNSGQAIDYIKGRKYYRAGQYQKALRSFDRVKTLSPFFPMALYYMAVIYYLNRDYAKAQLHFERCYQDSKNRRGSEILSRQYKLIRDLCQVGPARSLYAERKYERADFAYLDLNKKSIVWPSVLSEEAWSSYYQGNFNRTLGKLVTYNAPMLRYMINPEHEVLKAMSYMRMCLYNDVNKVVDDFYRNNEKTYRHLSNLLQKKKNPEYYFNMLQAYSYEKDQTLRYFLKGIVKEPHITVYFDHLKNAQLEFTKARSESSRLQSALISNIENHIADQRKVIGQHVYNKLQRLNFDLKKSFESMSYIRLEILSKKKSTLYQGKEFGGKRGDIKYLKRNDKQYFWTFNGEFWADELGDYVFALPTEC